MAYITNYNFSRLIADRETIGKGLAMEGHDAWLYPHKTIDWFSELEASRLYLCQVLLQGKNNVLFEKMLGKRWLKIHTPQDTFTRAVAPKEPRYHVDAICEMLRTPEFLDFELPVGFKEIYGEEGVIRFRVWLDTPQMGGLTPKKVFKENPERFKSKCEALWTRVSWHSVLLERKKNSGIHVFANFSLAALQEEIDKLLLAYGQWLDSLPPMERQAVETFKRRHWERNLSFGTLGQDKVAALLETFKQQFKVPMRYALLAYYYRAAWESGLDMVSTNALESLGFKPCAGCCGNDSFIDDI